MRLVFLGPPGSGKGTQAARLARRLRVAHISTGDALRASAAEDSPAGRGLRRTLESGHLVSDRKMEGVVRARLAQPDCAGGFLLDGYPRTVPQAEFLDRLLAVSGLRLDCVVLLEVPDEEPVRRLLARGRADDTPETVRKRLEVYRRQTEPLVTWYRARGLLRVADGTGTPDDVAARLEALLMGVSP